jgi:16S rRNA (guanine527-N7)-methyltransferase
MEKLKAGARKLGLHLSPEQIAQFETYYRELLDWNQRVNLTGITGYEEVQVRHFLDSLTVIPALQPPAGAGGSSIIDVGSGAGLPGIPVKILLPDTKLVLLEATAKKARFLSRLIARLELDDVAVVIGRAEEVAHDARYREKFELALSRAVAPLPALVELTLPFCVVGGSFVAQKKGAIETEVAEASRAITVLGGNLREIKRVDLEEFGDRRWLVAVDKVRPTPSQYPRRPGMPAKRPIV